MFLKTGTLTLLTKYDTLLVMSKNVASATGKSRLYIMFSAIYCMYKYGTIFTEYQALDFIHRSKKNRETFVTVLWLLKLLKKYNPPKYRYVFHDKRLFNKQFSEFTKRDSLSITTLNSALKDFLKKHNQVVLKKSDGCSGKQIYVSRKGDTNEFLINLIKDNKFDLVEEAIVNCDEIRRLNPTSLNTIRVVTFRSGSYFKIICACLRIGGIGAFVDNVSCGGTSARINLKTSKIDSVFCANSYRENQKSQKGRNEIGMVIPYWKEVVNMVEKASLVVPQIHYVGWDIAITERGPVMIEGNESFHTVIMQVYSSKDEPGIKNIFEETLMHIN